MDLRKERERDFHNVAFSQGTRSGVERVYDLTTCSRTAYQHCLINCCQGKRVLEYGCGPGSRAFVLGHHGAEVVGIDIADVAVEQAMDRARRENLEQVTFQVMDAEALEFPDDSFDVICGTGILHHLDLKRSFAELSRTLKPDGTAVFVEPLAHNPLINTFRRMTPRLRTPDEHPLTIRDLRMARQYFGRVETTFYHMSTLLALPFRRLPGFRALIRTLDTIDRGVFKVMPPTRRFAWQVLIKLSQPRVAQSGPVKSRDMLAMAAV